MGASAAAPQPLAVRARGKETRSMFRSYWKATLAAALSLGGLAVWAQTQYTPTPVSSTYGLKMPVGPAQAGGRSTGAQPLQPTPAGVVSPAERIITVQEPGKPPQQCKVLRDVRAGRQCRSGSASARHGRK